MRIKTILFVAILAFFYSCGSSKKIPISKYYNYDKTLPLSDSVEVIQDSTDFQLSYITYQSVHNKMVSGLLSIPKNSNKPLPVIVLLHGKGDRKTVDYIEFGNDLLLKSGYAVFRIDISNHGDRIENDFDFDLTGDTKYRTREIITQTVFDLRRAVDFIESKKELNAEKIGFLGISLGGITGTIFCGVDKRVKVPVLVLAGGQLNLMFGKKALSTETKDFTSIIEPKNYVEQISPRPLLMLNAENDDIIPPMMSKLLYKKANKPKEIIWYPAKHHTIPIDKVYQEGINWFDKYLK
ncbi:MAG: acetylxylan esterase [Bacteroidetes bacterium]|nr:acetylxylan esterase [Bacteroidota bacterium]